jgi:Icc-related predicted phosphoesterase
MVNCLFVSDLHGRPEKYHTLFRVIQQEIPEAVFFGGDLLPLHVPKDLPMGLFIEDTIFSPIKEIQKLTRNKTRFFIILGNDDPRIYEHLFIDADTKGIISYIHEKTIPWKHHYVTGYSYVPPTPFLLKDWERYDISRFVDVGAVSPEKGRRTLPITPDEARYTTIADDLETLSKNAPVEKTMFLFHSPPYDSLLDTIDSAGKMVDHAPLDTHIGSIAIQRFIAEKQPLVTLHGHAHESAQLTGHWMQRFGRTFSFSAAHDGPELAVVRFDTDALHDATRDLITVS